MLCLKYAAYRLVKTLVGYRAVLVILYHCLVGKLGFAPYKRKVISAGNGETACALLTVP